MSDPAIADAPPEGGDKRDDAAVRRELAGQAVVHTLLYLGMVILPAVALIWSHTQAQRWLWIGLASALTGVLVLPFSVRARLAIAAALIAAAIVVDVIALR